MSLVLFNSLTRQKEIFTPITDKQVRMYVCGMTVYDYCHIGHARSMVAFDMIRRYFIHLGYDITFVRNITDIDDKIIQRAAERGIAIHELTAEFIKAMHEDCEKLHILPPDHEPRATDHVDGMIQMIQTLIDKNLAYQADNGDVYYRVRQFQGYGKLSNQNIDDLQSGARVQQDQFKEDPLDFVLWKSAKTHEPSWASPFGHGRPGWHIECSVMSESLLGKTFDIHGGGMDLKFPHHECEIAQSEGANHCTMANYWMHNGFINIDNEKMSKSLGNFFTIRDVLSSGYPAEVLRFFILGAHYRSHLNYSSEQLDAAWNSLRRLYTALNNASVDTTSNHQSYSATHVEKFEAAMNDDFNTPMALAVLFDCATELNKTPNATLANTLRYLGNILGLLQQDAEQFLRYSLTKNIEDQAIDELIIARNLARQQKNWAESDRIRDLLKAHGVILEDSAQTTTWRRE